MQFGVLVWIMGAYAADAGLADGVHGFSKVEVTTEGIGNDGPPADDRRGSGGSLIFIEFRPARDAPVTVRPCNGICNGRGRFGNSNQQLF